jgi:hypothetical protein
MLVYHLEGMMLQLVQHLYHNEYKKFRPVIETIGLDKKIEMDKLKEEV